MSSATRSRVRALAVAAVMMLGLVLLAACSGGSAQPAPVADHATAPAPEAAAPTSTTPPTAAPTDTTEPTAAPTATLAPTSTPDPTATAAVEPSPTAAVVADAANCVTCHTSEESLQLLAKEEAPAEKLSEGEG
jgi:hypothetical protein